MATENFVNPRARFLDRDGNPLSGGRVFFYEAGTSTLKTVYTDYAGTIPADNPVELDAEGFVEPATGIHLGVGLYDIRVQELIGVNQWADYWTYPNITGAGLANAGDQITIGRVNTIEELRNLNAGAFDIVYVLGYYTAGDGGARWVKWDANGTETDNGGTIFTPTGTPAIGRWDWLSQTGDIVTPQLFGAFPSDGSLVVGSQIDSMINWCLSDDEHKRIHFNLSGEYWINSQSDFSGDLTVELEDGVVFRANAGGYQIIFSGAELIIHGKSAVTNPAPISGTTALEIRTKVPMDVYPEWWNVNNTALTNSGFMLNVMTQNLDPKHRIVFDGAYLAGSAVDYSANPVLFKNGATLEVDSSLTTFGKFYSESSTPVITGDISEVIFTEKSCLSSWLNWYGTAAPYHIVPEINAFIETNVGVSGSFNFKVEEEDKVIVLDHIIAEYQSGNDKHRRFNWTFTKPCLFQVSANGYLEFGYVSAGDYQVFAPVVASDYKMLFLNDVKISWWGAVSNLQDNVANKNAIRAAYSQCVESNYGNNQTYTQKIAVDFQGGVYKSDHVEASNAGAKNAEAIFKNGTIWCEDDSASYSLSLRYGLKASNFRFESRGLNTNLFYFEDNNVKFKDCTLQSKLAWITSSSDGKMVLIDNEFSNSNAAGTVVLGVFHAGENSVIKDNVFTRSQNATTGSTTIQVSDSLTNFVHNNCVGVGVTITGSGTVSHNYFDKASIVCQDPASTVVQYNKIKTSDDMDAKIYFEGSVATHTVDGLVCTNNTFEDGTADAGARAHYYAIDTNINMLNSGHYAEVHSNKCIRDYQYWGTTRINTELWPPSFVWPQGYNRITMDLGRSAVGTTYPDDHQYFGIFASSNGGPKIYNLNLYVDQGGSVGNQNHGVDWVNVRGNNLITSGLDIDFSLVGDDAFSLVLSGDICMFQPNQITHPPFTV